MQDCLKHMNKAMSFDVEAVCFILPRTFEKILFENKIDLRYFCVYKEPVPKNSFILDDKEYDVPCIFQIWEKRQHKRIPIIVDETKYFTLTTKQEATHAIRRVGGKSGCVLEGLDHSESSTYFVKMENSVAVVTGTHPGGLGETIKELLAINDYVVTEYGSDVTFEGAKKFFDDYKYPRIDVLINNYGIDKLNWIGEIEEEDYKVIDVNLKGVSIVVNELVKRGYKYTNILNVCSQTYRVAQRCTSLYCASKAGLAQMTRVMARELAPKGFIVNAIAPGKILGTLMTKK